MPDMNRSAGEPRDTGAAVRTVIYRHTLATRLLHWVNVICLAVLIMSGLQIFNAHPHLYWGQAGADTDPAWLSVGPFPGWLTLPGWQDLAAGRRWHFFFAWLLVFNSLTYLLVSLLTGHIRRDLLPTRAELTASHLGSSLREHALLRFPTGAAARHYNVLQKLAYVVVIFGLAPLMLMTGLALSPGIDSAATWLPELLGGRQSARSLHFLTGSAIVLFIVVHLVMVALAGTWNEVRSMVTGRFELPPARPR